MYSNNDFRSYELYHHGILGMKWGRKNGPPYPLNASDHSTSEKKAGWRDSLKSRRLRNSSDGDGNTESKKFKLTDKQKKAIKIGAAAVGIALAAYGGYKVYKAVKMVDAESMRRASQIIARSLHGEAASVRSSARIVSATNTIHNAKDIDIDGLVKTTQLSELEKGRTFKNIAKATLGEVKNDFVDARDGIINARNPFMTKADGTKYMRTKYMRLADKVSADNLEVAKRAYRSALNDLARANKDVELAKKRQAEIFVKELLERQAKRKEAELIKKKAVDALADELLDKQIRQNAGKTFDIINELNNRGAINLNESNISGILNNLGDTELIDKLLKSNAKKLGI